MQAIYRLCLLLSVIHVLNGQEIDVTKLTLPGHVPEKCQKKAGKYSVDRPEASKLSYWDRQHAATQAAHAGKAPPIVPARVAERGNRFNEPKEVGVIHKVVELMSKNGYGCERTGRACRKGGAKVGGNYWSAKHLTPLQEGGFGSCAIVATGRNLLGKNYGKVIDSYDTVIRIGYAPTKGFEKDVGSRADIYFVRPARSAGGAGRPGLVDVWLQAEQVPTKGFILQRGHVGMKGWYKEKPVYMLNDLATVPPIGVELYSLLLKHAVLDEEGKRIAAAGRGLRPTTGFHLYAVLSLSGLCTSIGLFGYSPDGFGHYFAGRDVDGKDAAGYLKSVHVAGLEYWSLLVAMANSLVCLFP